MKNNTYYDNILKKVLTETLTNKADELIGKINELNNAPTEFDYVAEGETCEQCGGKEMIEGECMECGGMREEDGEVMEKIYGKQSRIDKNKNGKIDSQDFKMMRKRRETKESDDINENVLYKLEYINESAVFTEDEIIDIIEGIIKEEDNIKRGKSPAGYSAYEKSHKGSGKEEDDYMKDLAKKMKDYLKDGSKGKYEMNPKIFPKGNGQLEKMEKKAYEISKDGEDFLNDYMRPGMENLDYDEIHPNEDWMKDNIEGSSRTGNNPEWANAEQTELGEKINKKRKEKKFTKNRRKAYNKSPQPVVSDKPGQESGQGLQITSESVNDKQTQKLTEEFTRMKQLMGYEDNTQ